MRMVLLTQYYPPEIGAAQARLSELAKHCVARGHEVFVLTALPSYPQGRIHAGYGGLVRRETLDGIHVVRAYAYPTQSVGMVHRLASYFSFVLSSLVVGLMFLPRADLLITESPPLFLGLSGFVLSRLKGSRWVLNVSDLWPESAVQLGVVREGWALRAARRLEEFCYRRAWLVTGQSREILADISGRFPWVSAYHLSNGVDASLFSPEDKSNRARRELIGAAEEGIVAIYAGLHGIAQGLDQLLLAAEQLRHQPGLRIVLVGDGPEKEALMERAKSMQLPNVCFLPPYPRACMPALMASADIALVLLKGPLRGAVPSKLYEAMGAGLPVVLVAYGEAAAIVHDARAGIVVSPDDIDGLSAALRDLTEHRDRRDKLGASGRRAAIERFDRRRINTAFVDRLETGWRDVPVTARGQPE